MALRPLTESVIDDQPALVGKQVRHLVPQAVLRVLRVGALKRLDRADRLGAFDIPRQTVNRRLPREYGRKARADREHRGQDKGLHHEQSLDYLLTLFAGTIPVVFSWIV